MTEIEDLITTNVIHITENPDDVDYHPFLELPLVAVGKIKPRRPKSNRFRYLCPKCEKRTFERLDTLQTEPEVVWAVQCVACKEIYNFKPSLTLIQYKGKY